MSGTTRGEPDMIWLSKLIDGLGRPHDHPRSGARHGQHSQPETPRPHSLQAALLEFAQRLSPPLDLGSNHMSRRSLCLCEIPSATRLESTTQPAGRLDEKVAPKIMAFATPTHAQRTQPRVRMMVAASLVSGLLAVCTAAALQSGPLERNTQLHSRQDLFAALMSPKRWKPFEPVPGGMGASLDALVSAPVAHAIAANVQPNADKPSERPVVAVAQVPDDIAPRFALELVLALDRNDTAVLPIHVMNSEPVLKTAFVMVRGLPVGAVLNNGEEVSAGTWGLTLELLNGLKITVPKTMSDEFEIRLDLLTATGSELARALALIRVDRPTLSKTSSRDPNSSVLPISTPKIETETSPSVTQVSWVLSTEPVTKAPLPTLAHRASSKSWPEKPEVVTTIKTAKGATAKTQTKSDANTLRGASTSQPPSNFLQSVR